MGRHNRQAAGLRAALWTVARSAWTARYTTFCEVLLQAPAGFGGGLALGSLAGKVLARWWVPAGLDHCDGEQGPVELAVASSGQAMPMGVAAGGRHRGDACMSGERCRAGIVAHVPDLAEDLRSDQRSHSRNGLQVCGGPLFQLAVDVFLEVGLFLGQGVQAADHGKGELGQYGVALAGA